jgi:hypothetical protein
VWLCFSDCFFSVVSKDCARDEVLVRARRKGDIKKLFPEAMVKRDDDADYLFRAPIKRAELSAALAREVERVTYANFKDSVRDDRLHSAYLRVWSALADLQPGKPWQFYRDLPLSFASPQKTAVAPKPGARKKPRRRRSLRKGA